MRSSALFLLIFSSLLCLSLQAGKMSFKDSAVLFPVPDRAFSLELSVPAGSEYRITDITGREIGHGKSYAGRDGFSVVKQKLSRGWYRISFAALKEELGIFVSPEVSNCGDFWCLDAGMTWSGWTQQHQQGVIRALQKRGIHSFRERMSWNGAENGKEFRDGHEVNVRKALYDRNVLELFQHMPDAFVRPGTPSRFDCRLELLAAGAKRMEERLNFSWDTVELWNEPFFFGGNLPADQYVPVAKALSAAYDTPVSGGCFSASIPQAYLRQCLESRFAEALDAFTLHIYSSPEEMADTVKYFRSQLEQSGNGDIPLWVSESGTPGSDKYPASNAITMRAIESLSLGVERFYAFYLQFHQEGTIRWGMTDQNGTPEFALAAYLTAAETIGARSYAGTIPLDKNVSLSRVFSGKDRDVLVLYGQKGASIELPALPRRFLGADGRALPAARTVTNTDGLAYAVFAPGTLKKFVSSGDENMSFYRMRGASSRRVRPQAVIQLPYPKGQVESHSNNGYVIPQEHAAEFQAAPRVYNFSNKELRGILTLTLPDGKVHSAGLTIPARGCAEAAFTVNFLKVLEDSGSCTLRYDFKSDACSDRITQLFCRPPTTVQKRIPFVNAASPDWSKAAVISDTTVKRDLPDTQEISKEEFSSTAKLAWSDNGLHYQVLVRDRRHEPGSDEGSCWQYDSLQLAVSQYNSTVDHNRFEWGFFLDGKGEARAATFVTSTGKRLSGDSAFRIERDENSGTTLYEGVIAWNDLGSMNAIYDRNGLRMRFTFCVNDHNAGRRRWSEWTPGIASDKSPALFAELILAAEADAMQVMNIVPATGRYSGEEGAFTVQNGAIRLLDKPKGALTFAMGPLSLEAPVTLRFKLAATEWARHNGTGFSFNVTLGDSASGEGYGLQLAPGRMFGGKSGFMLLEKNAAGPIIGTDGSYFPPDSRFHIVEFTIDTAARRQTLAVAAPDGTRKVYAQGPIVKNSTRSLDTIVFATSGWGAGPFLLKDIQILHQDSKKKADSEAGGFPAMNTRGVYINEDFGVFYHNRPASEMTEETLRRHVELYVAYGGVKAVVFNLNAQRAFFDSKVRTPIWEGLDSGKYSLKDPAGAFPWPGSVKRMAENCRLLHERLEDPVKVRREVCRKFGAEMWISMRMNDVHWVNEPQCLAHNNFWRTRPDCYRTAYRGLTWNAFALDYSRKDVFEYNLALVREYLERFDVDGFELDWMRTPPHVRTGLPDAGRSVLTEFMREVRKLAREAEVRVGHPVRIGVRVPDTPQTSFAAGMDVFTWVREELVDLVIPSPYVMSATFDMPVQLWKQLLGDKVELAPCVEAQIWNGRNEGFTEIDTAAARGFAASYHAMGADNIYLFNYFPSLMEPEGKQEDFRRFISTANDYDRVSKASRRHVHTAQENFLYDTGTRHCSRHSSAERELVVPFETGMNTAGRQGVIVVGLLPEETELPRVFCNGRECTYVPNRTFPYENPKFNSDTPLKMHSWNIPEGALQDGLNTVEAVTARPVDYLWLELDLEGS